MYELHRQAGWRIHAACAIAYLLASAWSACAMAGTIGVVSAIIAVMYVYSGIVVVVSIAALIACRWIGNLRLRMFVRLLIVILLYTPIPVVVGYDTTKTAPAFLMAFGKTLGGSHYGPHDGVFSHPFALAYGLALLLSLPVVMLWTHIHERYTRARKASQAQPQSNAVNAASHAPPT